MKNTFLFFLFLFPAFFSAQIPKDILCKKVPEQKYRAGTNKNSALESGALNNYDLVYHQCLWEIDPAVNFIKGRVKTFFKPASSNFNQIEFDLATNLTVDSVTFHTYTLNFTQQSGDLLRIQLPSILPVNVLDSVTVYYQGMPEGNGFGSFVQREHNGAPIIWTLSEPYGAKTWWPCKQNLVDKIDSIDIIVKAPQGNKVASNGLLISETVSGNDKFFHWKSRYPIATYLVAIAVTNYVEYSDYVPMSTGTLQVLNYVYPEDLASSQASTKAIVDIMQFYDSLLIDYPFAKEKYGHAQFSWTGGMEHQTMSFMAGFSISLMAHELAHQWFGDHVTCGSWQDIWLNEGFASYFEWLVTERYFKSDWEKGLPNVIKDITSKPDGSVLCGDTTQTGGLFDARLVYSKGAFLLRMLRWKIGDVPFFNALKNYLTDPALKNKYARTPQLQAHFEAASGQDLDRFFDQWYYKEGFPSYKVVWSQSESILTATLSQTQSDPSVSFFEMPVPVRFEAKGRDTLLIFNPTASGETFTANLDFTAVAATFDPEFRLLSANNTIFNPGDFILPKINISVYPNPTGKNISITGFLAGTRLEQVEITDAMGKIVYRSNETSILTGSLLLNTEALSGGFYNVMVRTNMGSSSLQFVKE